MEHPIENNVFRSKKNNNAVFSQNYLVPKSTIQSTFCAIYLSSVFLVPEMLVQNYYYVTFI